MNSAIRTTPGWMSLRAAAAARAFEVDLQQSENVYKDCLAGFE